MISILTFNILAPHFADPTYYLPGMSSLLAEGYRRKGTTRFLLQIKDFCDIMAFQEVTHDPISYDEFSYLVNVLGTEFSSMFVPHDINYWSEFGHNVVNGNALFFRKSIFSTPIWYDVPLLTGNHAIRGDVTHIGTKRKFRILNIHLDSERDERRNVELTRALNSLCCDASTVDIVLGDFNMEPSDKAFDYIKRAGFEDILQKLRIRTPTFFTMVNQPIDHIIYRDLTMGVDIIPSKSYALGCEIWTEYPKIGPFDLLAGPRLKAYLDEYGSDHSPIISMLRVNSVIM